MIRTTTKTLKISFSEIAGESHVDGKYAHKVYGFLQPLLTGHHSFAFNISNLTASVDLELWLSNSTNPLHTRKILTVERIYSPPQVIPHAWWEFWKPPPTIQPPHSITELFTSEAIWLNAGTPYYIEVLEKAFDGSVVVELEWKPPGSCNYIHIRSYSFLQAVKLNRTNSYIESPMATMLQGPLPSNALQTHKRVSFIEEMNFPISIPSIAEPQTWTSLPHCNFTASYTTEHTTTQWHVHNQVFFSGIYPHMSLLTGNYAISNYAEVNTSFTKRWSRKLSICTTWH
eukprot:Em0017g804a